MIGGQIETYKTVSRDNVNSIVAIIISEKPYGVTHYGEIKAEIPNVVIDNNLIEKGRCLWWEGSFIYMNIAGVPDNKFKKTRNMNDVTKPFFH